MAFLKGIVRLSFGLLNHTLLLRSTPPQRTDVNLYQRTIHHNPTGSLNVEQYRRRIFNPPYVGSRPQQLHNLSSFQRSIHSTSSSSQEVSGISFFSRSIHQKVKRLQRMEQFPGVLSRINCQYMEPRCAKEVLAREGCDPEASKKRNEDPCCKAECKDQMPRFDDLYYRPSDKATRKYTRTWAECPNIYIYPKQICCYEKSKFLEPEKRARQPPQVYCPVLQECMLMYVCRNSLAKRCSKLTWPGCRRARNPTKCVKSRKASDCCRARAPYPSFSECKRPLPPPLPIEECKCLRIDPLCKRSTFES